MSNLDEFFARKDKKKAGKKFATTKDVVKTLVKKQQAEEALRKEQEMLQNAVLEKASRTSLDVCIQNGSSIRLCHLSPIKLIFLLPCGIYCYYHLCSIFYNFPFRRISRI